MSFLLINRIFKPAHSYFSELELFDLR
jgi:hypothetical protein